MLCGGHSYGRANSRSKISKRFFARNCELTLEPAFMQQMLNEVFKRLQHHPTSSKDIGNEEATLNESLYQFIIVSTSFQLFFKVPITLK